MHIAHINPEAIEQLTSADRNDYTYAAALAVGTVAALPTMPVDSAAAWFEQNCKDSSARILSVFNEVRPIDFPRGMELVKELWMTRYTMIHGVQDGQDLPGIGLHCTILSLFNADTFLSNETRTYLETHAEGVRRLQYHCNIAARRIRDYNIKAEQTVE